MSSPADIPNVVANLRKGFESHITQQISWRVDQLKNLRTMLDKPENREALAVAMYMDLGRSRFEAGAYELDIALAEIDHLLHDLETNPNFGITPVSTNLINAPATSFVRNDPYGVVLVASPWNYPILLCLQPLAGALAAGNCVLVRPGTYSQHTSNALLKMIQASFDPAFVNCVIGDRDITTATLKERFDLMCFTGGSTLGQIYHKAANQHLTPCLLELGGSNPTIIWKDAVIGATARRLISTTFMNAGQTCIRPQVFFAHEAILTELVSEMKQCINSFYQFGDCVDEYRVVQCYQKYLQTKPTPALSISDWVRQQDKDAAENAKANQSLEIQDPNYKSNFEWLAQSPWLSRIITKDAFKRITNLIEQDREFVVFGGEYTKIDESNYTTEDLFISPTIMVFHNISDFNNAKSVLNGEIFGPIITILAINEKPTQNGSSLTGIIDWINRRDKPLALYCYTFDKIVQQQVLQNTSSGSLVFNDSILQITNSALPFGGVGKSGMGAYHGTWSLQSFSHQKAVLSKSKFNLNFCDAPLRYPPFTNMNQSVMNTVASLERYDFSSAKWVIGAPVLASAAYAIYAMLPHALPYLQSGLDHLKDFYSKQ